MTQDYKYVFIFGSQRTGSTLLYRLMGAHPEIDSTPNDFNLFQIRGEENDVSVQTVLQSKKWKEWGFELTKEELGALSEGPKVVVLRRLLNTYFRKSEAKYRLHKTPKGEWNLASYRAAFEGAKFIYIVRNPLGIMSSRKYWKASNRSGEWIDLSSSSLTLSGIRTSFGYIKAHLYRAFRSFTIIDKEISAEDTLGVISYAALVKRPRNALEGLYSKMGLDGHRSLQTWVGSSFDPFTSYTELAKKKGIYTDAIGKWKVKLTPFEIRVLLNEMYAFRKKLRSKRLLKLFDEYGQAGERELDKYGTTRVTGV